MPLPHDVCRVSERNGALGPIQTRGHCHQMSQAYLIFLGSSEIGVFGNERDYRGIEIAEPTAVKGDADQQATAPLVMDAGLEQQHEAELARRQAALDTMARATQTQQLINAVNRPIMTNCTNLESGMVNCTSY